MATLGGLIVAGIVLLGFACSDDGDQSPTAEPTASVSDTPSPTEPEGPVTAVPACDILTADEARSLLGTPTDVRPETIDESTSRCHHVSLPGVPQDCESLQVTVWSGDDVTFVRGAPGPGLGDDSFFDPDAGLVVQRGSVWATFLADCTSGADGIAEGAALIAVTRPWAVPVPTEAQ